jgi:hypothetical protein
VAVVSLPETIRVKISSESVEASALSPVVSQEMQLEELIRLMLGVTGKNVDRLEEILRRGSLVSGASRFRWTGFGAAPDELRAYLSRYPDSDPTRRFDASRCFLIVIKGPRQPLILEREAGEKRKMFRSRSFWDEIMAAAETPEYVEYSYRERADMFRLRFGHGDQQRVRDAARLLVYSSYEKQIRESGIDSIDLFVRR